jgi:hypothetical protein
MEDFWVFLGIPKSTKKSRSLCYQCVPKLSMRSLVFTLHKPDKSIKNYTIPITAVAVHSACIIWHKREDAMYQNKNPATLDSRDLF